MAEPSNEPKIYLLPNLMTAGNLACGFFAVLTIFRGIQAASPDDMSYDFSVAIPYYKQAILLIFGSCIFDLLDGRLARLGGKESPFGAEFDSLADVISFGMAPALLVSRAVLFDLPENQQWLGWTVAFAYLLCGAMRLARFNCIAAMPKQPGASMDFQGLPIPMAAGFIASLTFLMSHLYEGEQNLGNWTYVLVVMMLGLALLMMSRIPYPSFKKVSWRTRANIPAVIIITLVIASIVKFPWLMPAVLFTVYLVYGFLRPFFGRKLEKEIEENLLVDDEEN